MKRRQILSEEQRHPHPYLSGNFAPARKTQSLTPCFFTGSIPAELAGGEYVRNGGNPVTNEQLGRDAHWFDGDGMLSGVLFSRDSKGGIVPEYVNQYILTDVFVASKVSSTLQTPILPSIATLVNPFSPLITILLRIFRTIFLVILSHLPGSIQSIRKISVANTAFIYHDGRALATCESGPPMRIALPGLETIGWYNGHDSEGERGHVNGNGFGAGSGLIGFMREWATAHPRVDPRTKEMLLYHSTFIPPYVRYSIIPPNYSHKRQALLQGPQPMLNQPVPGIKSAKMMHDFGVTSTHTIIMDLPLSLDPLNLAKNIPAVAYDPMGSSRFGVFPRYQPGQVRWYETKACCIFHTANSWNSSQAIKDAISEREIETVNMLACRLTSASLVFSAGDLAAPTPIHKVRAEDAEEEQCRLYYYQFSLDTSSKVNVILQQWALSAVPFEFPSVRDSVAMNEARFIYGCSVSDASFGAALGRAVKINSLVKVDVSVLIARGKASPPASVRGCVDERSLKEIYGSTDPHEPIQVFQMPPGWYAQEPRFVPRQPGPDATEAEDDGWLLSYVFDESQLDEEGECKVGATSELWIVDARNMKDVVARVQLPQRVPYGLHGNWMSENDVQHQRPFERVRRIPTKNNELYNSSTSCVSRSSLLLWMSWMRIRNAVEAWLS